MNYKYLAVNILFLVSLFECGHTTPDFDLAVEINANDNFTLGEANKYSIIVTNKQTGNETTYFSLEKGIYNELSSFNTYKWNMVFNQSSKAIKYSHWTPYEEGGFEICVQIYNLSREDLDENNNKACKNITVVVAQNNSINNTNEDEDESQELLNDTGSTHNECDISLNVRTDKELYASGDKIGIYIDVKDDKNTSYEKEYTLSYWIEDLFGNVIKKSYKNTYDMTDEDMRTYGPGAPDIGDSEAYIISAQIINSTCNDTDETNNRAYKMIVVRGNQNGSGVENKSQSYLMISKISGENAQFGDVTYAEIEAYRGDTSKYSANIRIERPSDGYDVSEKTTIQLKEKYIKYVLKVPIQIKPNCNGKYKSGTYNIVLEGLDAEDSREIYISGISDSLCITETKTVTKYVYKGTGTQTAVAQDNGYSNSGGIEAEGKEKKDIELDIAPFEDYVCPDEPFVTNALIENNADMNKTIYVYSYVISGKTRLSEGLSSAGWVKSWTGNRVDVTVAPGERITINLTNRISKNVSGNFSFRIKIKGDVDDMIESTILVRNVSECLNDPESENTTMNGEYSANQTDETEDEVFGNLDDQYSRYHPDADYRVNENNIGFKVTSKSTEKSFFGKILDKIVNFFMRR